MSKWFVPLVALIGCGNLAHAEGGCPPEHLHTTRLRPGDAFPSPQVRATGDEPLRAQRRCAMQGDRIAT